MDSINNNPALFQIMAWRHPGDKPLSEPMMVNLLTHICVTRPQWVNSYWINCVIWWWFWRSFWSPHNILTVVLAKKSNLPIIKFIELLPIYSVLSYTPRKKSMHLPFFWKVPVPKIPGIFPPRCSGSPARVFLREQQATNERGTGLYFIPAVEFEYQLISCFQNRLKSINKFQIMGVIISLAETHNFSCCLISVGLHSHLNVVSDIM